MCIIITTQNGEIPREHLANALDRNPDGWGYIFRDDDGRMVLRKGMYPDGFWKRWNKDQQDRQGKNLIFHARIGTSGVIDRINCHPFRVGRLRLWVAHNGIIAGHTVKDSRYNDTRNFIDSILNDLPIDWYNNASIWVLIEKYIGTSKLAFMNGDGEILIVNEQLGKRKKKRWYSNETYKPIPPQPKQVGFYVNTQRSQYNANLPARVHTQAPAGGVYHNADDDFWTDYYAKLNAGKRKGWKPHVRVTAAQDRKPKNVKGGGRK